MSCIDNILSGNKKSVNIYPNPFKENLTIDFKGIGGAMMGDNTVSAMCTYNGQLFVGGNFGSCGARSANNLGCWNGSSWSTIGTGMNGKVNSLAVYHGDLYIAGTFTDASIP